MSPPADVDFVLPMAGECRRVRGQGNKCALPVAGASVAERLAAAALAAFPAARVWAVVGFDSARVRNALPTAARTVFNRHWQECGAALSVAAGISRCRRGVPCVVAYGDWAVRGDFFEGLPLSPCVLTEESPERAHEAGLAVAGGLASSFGFGRALRWAQVAVLDDAMKEEFFRLARLHPTYLSHELLARLVEGGARLAALPAAPDSGVEIDGPADLERAEALARGWSAAGGPAPPAGPERAARKIVVRRVLRGRPHGGGPEGGGA